jgi:hypothetical protein
VAVSWLSDSARSDLNWGIPAGRWFRFLIVVGDRLFDTIAAPNIPFPIIRRSTATSCPAPPSTAGPAPSPGRLAQRAQHRQPELLRITLAAPDRHPRRVAGQARLVDPPGKRPAEGDVIAHFAAGEAIARYEPRRR